MSCSTARGPTVVSGLAKLLISAGEAIQSGSATRAAWSLRYWSTPRTFSIGQRLTMASRGMNGSCSAAG